MLYYSTVSSDLKYVLKTIMDSEIFKSFRLVGGTSLSLQLGHRISVDIDLFTDNEYGSIDFTEIEFFLQSKFPFFISSSEMVSFGKSFFVGISKENAVKLDIFYTDPFISEELKIDNISFASLKEVAAMKIEVIQNGGRKKDFWDLHQLLEHFSLVEMLSFHEERYPFSHDLDLILKNFTNFEIANEDFDVICLQGKHWETIKFDFVNLIKKLQ